MDASADGINLITKRTKDTSMFLLSWHLVRLNCTYIHEPRSLICPLVRAIAGVLAGQADIIWVVQACYSQAAEERSAGRIPAETKECRRCHETKGKADFYHSKMTADGLQSYCKVLLLWGASQPSTPCYWFASSCTYCSRHLRRGVAWGMYGLQDEIYHRGCHWSAANMEMDTLCLFDLSGNHVMEVTLACSNATLWHQHSGAPEQQRAPCQRRRMRMASRM